MGTSLPKQFIKIAGKPLIVHTISVFHEFDPDIEIIVVLPADQLDEWKRINDTHLKEIAVKVVSGGSTRFHSVRNALKVVSSESIIGVHDAVRPLVSKEVIQRSYTGAEKNGNAVPAIMVSESLRKVEGENNFPLPREQVKIIQTPQVFRGDILREAYTSEYRAEFTDDASVVEKRGVKIHLVEGNPENIKITYPIDMEVARYYLEKK